MDDQKMKQILKQHDQTMRLPDPLSTIPETGMKTRQNKQDEMRMKRFSAVASALPTELYPSIPAAL